ncbi:MAG: hypothetical protein GTN97_03330 [Nitrosopumilaceae archaeon]|nr:hypothetical protein [Nitrosopumilaceae archaeon]
MVGNGEKSLKSFRKTQKRVSKQIRNREGMGNGGRIGDELAKLSGISSAQRRNRPKDDPFNRIGL